MTRPFSFEGRRRALQADSGIEALRQEVDTLIVIPNDRLLSMADRSVSALDAFHSADQVLLSGVQGITDLITTPGLINLDFADVKSVMQGAGSALMGIGSARGEDRAVQAAELAISSPLLEASIDGAHGVLISIQGGSDLGLQEINEAARLVQEAAHTEANIIFGTVIDDALGDEVRVTVIAAGFDGGSPQPRKESAHLGSSSAAPQAPHREVPTRREEPPAMTGGLRALHRQLFPWMNLRNHCRRQLQLVNVTMGWQHLSSHNLVSSVHHKVLQHRRHTIQPLLHSRYLEFLMKNQCAHGVSMTSTFQISLNRVVLGDSIHAH